MQLHVYNAPLYTLDTHAKTRSLSFLRSDLSRRAHTWDLFPRVLTRGDQHNVKMFPLLLAHIHGPTNRRRTNSPQWLIIYFLQSVCVCLTFFTWCTTATGRKILLLLLCFQMTFYAWINKPIVQCLFNYRGAIFTFYYIAPRVISRDSVQSYRNRLELIQVHSTQSLVIICAYSYTKYRYIRISSSEAKGPSMPKTMTTVL